MVVYVPPIRSVLRPASIVSHRPDLNGNLPEPYNHTQYGFLSLLIFDIYVEVVHQRSVQCDLDLSSPPRHLVILPDPNAFLIPTLVNHTSHVTSKGSIYNLGLGAGVNQHGGLLVVDLAYILGLFKPLYRSMILLIRPRLPWGEIKFHLHRGSSIFVRSFHTRDLRDKSRTTTRISDRINRTFRLLISL